MDRTALLVRRPGNCWLVPVPPERCRFFAIRWLLGLQAIYEVVMVLLRKCDKRGFFLTN